MPLYEYECKQCHQRLEKIQSFSAPHETKCPKCGGELERVISAPAIQFKGAGWYVNDYAKSGSKAAIFHGFGRQVRQQVGHIRIRWGQEVRLRRQQVCLLDAGLFVVFRQEHTRQQQFGRLLQQQSEFRLQQEKRLRR